MCLLWAEWLGNTSVFRSWPRISNFIEHQKTLRLSELSGVKQPYSYFCIDYCVYPRSVVNNQINISWSRLTFDEGLPSVSSFLRPRQALGIRLARHARTCSSGAQGQLLLCSLTLLYLGFSLRVYFSLTEVYIRERTTQGLIKTSSRDLKHLSGRPIRYWECH